MADINDRLDRLNRREQLARRAGRLDPTPPHVAPPAGADAGFAEVLEAVARVVRRRPGLSVMVAMADGRPGRPVMRVTGRGGEVETAVVAAGTGAHAARLVPDGRHAADPSVGEAAGGRGANGSQPTTGDRSAGGERAEPADRPGFAPEPGPATAYPGPAGGMVVLPTDTSEVVARLAQLLREDPTLASSWGREAQES